MSLQVCTDGGRTVNSYHRFWLFVLGGGAIVLSLVVLLVSQNAV